MLTQTKTYTCKIMIKRRWWVTPYMWTLATLCAIMGTAPDYHKAGAFLAKYGFKYKTVFTETTE